MFYKFLKIDLGLYSTLTQYFLLSIGDAKEINNENFIFSFDYINYKLFKTAKKVKI